MSDEQRNSWTDPEKLIELAHVGVVSIASVVAIGVLVHVLVRVFCEVARINGCY